MWRKIHFGGQDLNCSVSSVARIYNFHYYGIGLNYHLKISRQRSRHDGSLGIKFSGLATQSCKKIKLEPNQNKTLTSHSSLMNINEQKSRSRVKLSSFSGIFSWVSPFNSLCYCSYNFAIVICPNDPSFLAEFDSF